MTEISTPAGTRDRSPAYPSISLGPALERLAQFDAHFKRSPARPGSIGDAWSIKAKAHADRMAAALKYFGLLDYQGAGAERHIVVSDEGRKYLRAQQEETKREVIKAAALRPRALAKFWALWGRDRPADAACLDDLVLKNGFSEVGGREFLKVYDATIAFAGLSDSDKFAIVPEGFVEEEGEETPDPEDEPVPPAKKRKVQVMEGERELTTGMLPEGASFRLIVSGGIGVKQIEYLIKKLELDKEILGLGEMPEHLTKRNRPPLEIGDLGKDEPPAQ